LLAASMITAVTPMPALALEQKSGWAQFADRPEDFIGKVLGGLKSLRQDACWKKENCYEELYVICQKKGKILPVVEAAIEDLYGGASAALPNIPKPQTIISDLQKVGSVCLPPGEPPKGNKVRKYTEEAKMAIDISIQDLEVLFAGLR